VTTFRSVRVAAVQATPVILDAEGCAAKAEELMRAAADDGAELVVLPECFIPFYPMSRLTRSDWDPRQTDLYERMWLNSVDVPGPITERLAAVCAELGVHVALGVNERESDRPGTLYNSLLLIGPTGVLLRHRKLMPTHHERLFHGVGAGDDLTVADTPIGRIGGLICWENYMPLARYAIYRGGPQIWLAPTMEDRDVWTGLMQTIAMESGAWVVGVCGYSRLSDYPDELIAMAADGPDELTRGGTVVVAPGGEVVAGPLYGEEGMLVVDCDLRRGLRAKYAFDAVGHYGREELLLRVLGSAELAGEPTVDLGGGLGQSSAMAQRRSPPAGLQARP
jgi:nitrilase